MTDVRDYKSQDLMKIKFTRKKLVQELNKQGLPGFMEGYQNLHLLPIYQRKIAYGNKGFPWSTFKPKLSYKKGLCPIAEQLHQETFLNFEICKYDLSKADIDFITNKFIKIWKKLQD